jgi:hypothetical protein
MSTLDRKKEFPDLWDARIVAYVASGFSSVRWCKENGIADHQLVISCRKETRTTITLHHLASQGG